MAQQEVNISPAAGHGVALRAGDCSHPGRICLRGAEGL